MDRAEALDTALGQIERQFGKGSVMKMSDRAQVSVGAVSTGSLALEELGVYERERRDWLPHVSVARFREQPRLQPSLPELGEFSPSEAAVYHSLLRPGGASYEILESFALGG